MENKGWGGTKLFCCRRLFGAALTFLNAWYCRNWFRASFYIYTMTTGEALEALQLNHLLGHDKDENPIRNILGAVGWHPSDLEQNWSRPPQPVIHPFIGSQGSRFQFSIYPKNLCESWRWGILNVRQNVVKSFLRGQLPPGQTQEIQNEILALGIPL